MFRSGGPGGQHQNKTESGVRYTHLPTGVAAESRSERSQHKNDANALAQLKAKLVRLEEEEGEADSAKKYDEKRAKSASAARSAPTSCSRTNSSRICGPTTRLVILAPFLTATSTASSRLTSG